MLLEKIYLEDAIKYVKDRSGAGVASVRTWKNTIREYEVNAFTNLLVKNLLKKHGKSFDINFNGFSIKVSREFKYDARFIQDAAIKHYYGRDLTKTWDFVQVSVYNVGTPNTSLFYWDREKECYKKVTKSDLSKLYAESRKLSKEDLERTLRQVNGY